MRDYIFSFTVLACFIAAYSALVFSTHAGGSRAEAAAAQTVPPTAQAHAQVEAREPAAHEDSAPN